jgi:hypothetical protein
MRSKIHPRLPFLGLIVAIVICTGPSHAQQNNSTAGNSQPTDKLLREKAFNLLESLAGQIGTLQSAENRARLGSNIVASLWAHDEKRARTLLVSVEEDIKAGLQYRESNDPEDIQTFRVFLQLRNDTVERIAKHDAESAFAFLKATELISDEPLPYPIAESERAWELRLAKQIVANNPDIALKVGRQSLARGFSHDLLSLLKTLNRKHKEQALILYKEIIFKLRDANLTRDWQAWYFAQNLAQSFTPPTADESIYKELINIFITSAEANGCSRKTSEGDQRTEFCNRITSLIDQIEKPEPSREGPETPREASDELQELTENGTVEEILELARKYPQMAGDIHWQAILKAQASGDVERARKIATEFNGEPEWRNFMLVQTERYQTRASIDNETLAEMQKRLSTIPPIQGVGVLLTAASQIGANDRKTALKLLNQAIGIIQTMKPGKEQTLAQMGLAIVYCLEKNDRGLAIMESLVPKLNDLIAAAIKLENYDNRYVRDGEWNMTGEGGLGSFLTNLARCAGYFAWCDFDRAVSLAGQFERPEIRLMAQLKLAQGILDGPPKRLSMVNAPLP